MYEAGYSVLIQSKLADDISSVESDDHKLLWAITLDTDQDDLGKKIAPGAPLISTRLKHIERLTASGHKVIVLMCPYVDAWYKDIEGFVARLYEIGVTGIWAEPLHLSRTKYKKHVKKKDILTTEQLQDAYNIVWYPDLLRQACKKQKMPLFSSKLGVFGNIYAGIEKLYPRRMPSFQEFLAMSKEYDVYCFEDFMEYAEPLLPKGVFNMREYIVQNEKDENVRKYKIPNNLTYKELAAVSWGLRPEISKSFLSVHTKLPFMSYLEKNGKIGQLNGKPLYCINYGLHDVIEI
jgi:DNA repair photolyase